MGVHEVRCAIRSAWATQCILDILWSGAGGPAHPELLRQNAYISMSETAQNVADRYGLTREEIDAFALRSHHHAAEARGTGRLAKEIVSITIPATPPPA
ncbi:thiolase family protein [Nonomuraea cypriaca]|nr:hypothetical protein [Nonomuraea cypriaca]